MFWVGNNATVNLYWSTVTDNQPGTGVFRFGGSNFFLRLRGSIIHEPGRNMGVVSPADTPAVNSDCIVWHSGSLMNPPYNFIGAALIHQVADPVFDSPGSNNYQLTETSPAVDFCDLALPPGQAPEHDLLMRPRGIPVKPSPLIGYHDLGAFEFLPDRIFQDRFQ